MTKICKLSLFYINFHAKFCKFYQNIKFLSIFIGRMSVRHSMRHFKNSHGKVDSYVGPTVH